MTGFIKETTQEKTSIVANDFRHALCTGETGCGKTTSFMLPNISDRIEKNYGMLIIDVKGNLHSHVKVIASKHNRLKDVKEIGVPWGDSINIFENITRSLFLDTLNNINGESGDKFWITSALNLAGHFYDTFAIFDNLQSLIGDKIDLKFLYKLDAKSLNQILSNYGSFKYFIKKCRYVVEVLSVKNTANLLRYGVSKDEIYLIVQFKHEFDSVIDKVENFYNDIDQESPASGSGGVYFMLKNLMHLFSQNGLDGNVELKELLEDGKIVVLHADTYDENLNLSLMNILYKRLLIRNNERQLTLFIDEFQRSVSKNNIPFIDLFREMNVELIASVQNIQQLENKLGEVRCSEFLGNILHNYEFSNHRENSLQTFEYIYQSKKSISKPIFINDKEQIISQIRWQNFSDFALPLGWIYIRADGYKRALISHTKTKQIKYHYILDNENKILKSTFSA